MDNYTIGVSKLVKTLAEYENWAREAGFIKEGEEAPYDMKAKIIMNGEEYTVDFNK